MKKKLFYYSKRIERSLYKKINGNISVKQSTVLSNKRLMVTRTELRESNPRHHKEKQSPLIVGTIGHFYTDNFQWTSPRNGETLRWAQYGPFAVEYVAYCFAITRSMYGWVLLWGMRGFRFWGRHIEPELISGRWKGLVESLNWLEIQLLVICFTNNRLNKISHVETKFEKCMKFSWFFLRIHKINVQYLAFLYEILFSNCCNDNKSIFSVLYEAKMFFEISPR